MAARKKSTLLAQGKVRRLDGTGWPWRVRLCAPRRRAAPATRSSSRSQLARASLGSRCCDEQTRRPRPARSSPKRRPRSTPGRPRRLAPRCVQLARSKLSLPSTSRTAGNVGRRHARSRVVVPRERAHRPGDRHRARREVVRRTQPEGHGARIEDDPLRPRTRGSARRDGGDAQACVAVGLARPERRPARRRLRPATTSMTSRVPWSRWSSGTAGTSRTQSLRSTPSWFSGADRPRSPWQLDGSREAHASPVRNICDTLSGERGDLHDQHQRLLGRPRA